MFNFKENKKTYVVVSASILTLSLMLSGCNQLPLISNNTDTDINNTKVMAITQNSDENIVSFVEETKDTSISDQNTEPVLPSEKAQVITLSAEERAKFIEDYCNYLEVPESIDIKERTSCINEFMFDKNMNEYFINYYNNLKGTNFESISRIDMINLFNGYMYYDNGHSNLEYPTEEVTDAIVNQMSCCWGNPSMGTYTDPLITSYLARNNLPLGHIFSYDEVSMYCSEIPMVDSIVYVYRNSENTLSNTMPANEYLAYLMVYHNANLSAFTGYSWVDTETFDGEYKDLFGEKVVNLLNEKFANEIGVEPNVNISELMTPEKFEEIYGYAPLDVSPETLQDLTAKEAKSSYQR